MVIAQRVAAIQEYVEAGRDVNVSYAFAATTGRLRAKVRIGPRDGVVAIRARPLLRAALLPLLDALETHVVVDRGHTFSSGHAWACFWLQPRVAPPQSTHAAAAELEVEQVHSTDTAEDVQEHQDDDLPPLDASVERLVTETGATVALASSAWLLSGRLFHPARRLLGVVQLDAPLVGRLVQETGSSLEHAACALGAAGGLFHPARRRLEELLGNHLDRGAAG